MRNRSHRKTTGPPVDGNRKRDIASKSVVCDRRRPRQEERVVEGPDVRADGNADAEELLAGDDVVSHKDVGIAAAVQVVDHVDGAKAFVGGGRSDRIAGYGGAGSAEQDDSSVSAAGDL